MCKSLIMCGMASSGVLARTIRAESSLVGSYNNFVYIIVLVCLAVVPFYSP